MAHPLSGADPLTLGKVVMRSGLPSHWLSGLGIASAVLARSPASAIEYAVMNSKLTPVEELAPPVFILGHWRSGTTHLYNIMCQSGAWSYVPPVATGLPWDLFGIASIFRPLLEKALPKHRYIDNIPVTPESPQEDEIAIANMTDISFYHAIYFPRAFRDHMMRGLFFDGCTPEEMQTWRRRFEHLMQKLSKYQDEKPLLIKNPVYTARASLLREIFPQAKFIHIHRNPYDVFRSMQNFYKKLFAEFALQSYEHVDIDETIFEVYERMMSDYERDASNIPADKFVELRYDALDSDPLTAIETCYSALSLPGFDAAKPKFSAYLQSVAKFEKNDFSYDPAVAKKVEKRLGYYIDKWGYQKPA